MPLFWLPGRLQHRPTQAGLSVPMLMTRAEAIPTISSISSSAWAMTGEAPMARRALAVLFMTT